MLFGESKKKAVLLALENDVAVNGELLLEQVNIAEDLKSGVLDYFKDDVKRINDMVSKLIPEDVIVPKASVRVTMPGKVANITLSNKYTDKSFEFKYKFSETYREGLENKALFEEVLDRVVSVYKALIIEYMVRENLKRVNAVLEEVSEKAGIDYIVKVTSSLDGNEGRKIDFLSDNEVVFIVDKDVIFNIENIAVMKDPDSFFTEENIAEAKDEMSKEFATAHSTLEFVANKGFSVISYLCGLKKGTKAFTYIKKITGRKCQSVHSDGLVYYQNGDVYSIISVSGDGNEVVLSPFNIKTLEKVDGVDVLAEVAQRI